MARGTGGAPPAGREQERSGRRSAAGGRTRRPEGRGFAVGPSPVHGRGLFARRRYRRGAFIGRFEGTRTDRDGEHVLWVLDDDGSHYGLRGRNALRFLNHSRRPNAEFRGALLYALRNIEPGHEIFIHYGDDWEDVP